MLNTVFTLNTHNLALYLILSLTSSLLSVSLCKIAERVANSVDPDQTPRSAASDLGLRCSLRFVCPKTE